MNILLIVILLLLGLGVLSGYKNGFLKTVFSLVSWVIVLVICNIATPIATEALMENTDLNITIQSTIDQAISEAIGQTVESSGIGELEAASPAEIKDALLGEDGSLQVFEEQGLIDTTSLVYDIMCMIGFLVVAVVARIAILVVEFILGIVAKLPLIGPADKLLGIICGAGKGLIWCWIVLAAAAVLAFTGVNTTFASYIGESQILTWLQENNIFLNLIIKA